MHKDTISKLLNYINKKFFQKIHIKNPVLNPAIYKKVLTKLINSRMTRLYDIDRSSEGNYIVVD